MQARRTLKEVAQELGLELRGKSQQELWDEIVRRVTAKTAGARVALPARRRESPQFRWAGRRGVGD